MAGDWLQILSAIAAASVAGGGLGAGGTYALINWRLKQLEDRLKEADSRAQIGELAALKADVEALKARVNPQNVDDWVGWRARLEGRVEDLEKRRRS